MKYTSCINFKKYVDKSADACYSIDRTKGVTPRVKKNKPTGVKRRYLLCIITMKK
uniref:Uncharacterized protein n=1 Tax=Phage sp. ctGns7 TaxID=2828003 RepID=A0A8S5S8X4_9VIRU|nr:MAG TPA: hypothetical protein [Phage sp. ctGns7]